MLRRAEEQRATQTIDENSTATTSSNLVDEEATMQRSGRKRNTDTRSSAAKRKYLRDTEASSNNENQCCVCFEMYDSLQGNWVQCSCTRWLHEDCVLDAIKDADGKVRLCPYYVMINYLTNSILLHRQIQGCLCENPVDIG